MKPKLQPMKEESTVVHLPYADAPTEPETWAIDMVLENSLPQDIADCLLATTRDREALVESIEEYKEFESQLPDVIYDRQYAVCKEFTVKFPPGFKPESAKGRLLLAKAARQWEIKRAAGVCRNIIIKYCKVCGRADCDYMPVRIVLTIKGN